MMIMLSVQPMAGARAMRKKKSKFRIGIVSLAINAFFC
ncbi:MAG: hypothetical protein ACI9KE_001300 [Polyangiales bacterium]|jgi:hypothetical protein